METEGDIVFLVETNDKNNDNSNSTISTSTSTTMTSGGVDLMEHKDVNMESEETEEARAESAKRKAYNQKKKEKKKEKKTREGLKSGKKKRTQELVNMDSGEKSLKEIKVDRAELEIEIGDTQYLIDTNTDVAQEMAQEDMV